MARSKKAKLGEHALPITVTALLLWLVGALCVRSFPGLFEARSHVMLAMLVSVPLAVVIMLAMDWILGLERNKALPAATLLAVIALACHVLALIWWPSLYGADESIVRHGSAWLVWTFAAIIGAAWVSAER